MERPGRGYFDAIALAIPGPGTGSADRCYPVALMAMSSQGRFRRLPSSSEGVPRWNYPHSRSLFRSRHIPRRESHHRLGRLRSPPRRRPFLWRNDRQRRWLSEVSRSHSRGTHKEAASGAPLFRRRPLSCLSLSVVFGPSSIEHPRDIRTRGRACFTAHMRDAAEKGIAGAIDDGAAL